MKNPSGAMRAPVWVQKMHSVS